MTKIFTQRDGYDIRCDRCLLTTESILAMSEKARPRFDDPEEMDNFALEMGFTCSTEGFHHCRTCDFVGKVFGV